MDLVRCILNDQQREAQGKLVKIILMVLNINVDRAFILVSQYDSNMQVVFVRF